MSQNEKLISFQLLTTQRCLGLNEIGWSLVESADKAWKGLTELFFPLWEAVGRPDLSEDEAGWLRATRTTDILDR
jgi:hypothetical protein